MSRDINCHNIVFCFALTLKNGKNLLYTNAASDLNIDGIIYKHNGIKLEYIIADDSGMIKGAISFITRDALDFTRSVVKIYIYSNEKIKLIYKFTVSSFTLKNHSYVLKLKGEIVKLQISVTKKFSETCRAEFCDSKCSLSQEKFTYKYEILQLKPNLVRILGFHENANLFENGYLVVDNYKIKIIKHLDDKALLNEDMANLPKEAKFIVGCNKKYSSCCNQFKNAINFRGEPFIPKKKDDLLKS